MKKKTPLHEKKKGRAFVKMWMNSYKKGETEENMNNIIIWPEKNKKDIQTSLSFFFSLSLSLFIFFIQKPEIKWKINSAQQNIYHQQNITTNKQDEKKKKKIEKRSMRMPKSTDPLIFFGWRRKPLPLPLSPTWLTIEQEKNRYHPPRRPIFAFPPQPSIHPSPRTQKNKTKKNVLKLRYYLWIVCSTVVAARQHHHPAEKERKKRKRKRNWSSSVIVVLAQSDGLIVPDNDNFGAWMFKTPSGAEFIFPASPSPSPTHTE